MANSSFAGWMAWLSSLAKCQIKPKKTVVDNLNRHTFSAGDFFLSTRAFFFFEKIAKKLA
jgi:hypothetical protein